MAKLNAQARQAIREAGLTLAEWARVNGSTDGTWTGDQCGCPDDRCANGFHHVRVDDCGCLPVLLDRAVAWREATRWPNSVELAAPYGLFNWVTASTPGVLVTVSATAGTPGRDAENSRVSIEVREGWTAEVTEQSGKIEVRIVRAAPVGLTGEEADGGS